MTRLAVGLLLAWPFLGAACSGRKPSCDQGKVDAAKNLIAGDGAGPLERGKAALLLGEACSLNEGVVKSLLMEYGEGLAAGDTYLWSRDEEFTALMREVCKDPDAAKAASERRDDAAVFEACGFGELGVLEADETYAPRHRPALVLFHALRRAGLAESEARSISRAYIESTAPPGSVQRLPHSTSTLSGYAHPFSVAIDAEAVRIRGTSFPLEGGRLPANRNAELERVLADMANDATQMGLGGEFEALLIRAGAEDPVEALVELMFAATKMRHGAFRLAVQNRGELAALVVDPPVRWLEWISDSPNLDRVAYRTTRATVADGQMTLERGGKTLGSASIADGAGMEALAMKAWRDEPTDRILDLRVHPETSVQDVVSVIEAVRGSECPAGVSDADMDLPGPPDCAFPRVQLDLRPGMPRRGGAMEDAKFEVLVTRERHPVARGSESDTQLAERARQALPAVRECLEASLDAQSWRPEFVVVAFGDDESGHLSVRFGPWTQYAQFLPHDCIEKSFGLPIIPIERMDNTFAEVRYQVSWE